MFRFPNNFLHRLWDEAWVYTSGRGIRDPGSHMRLAIQLFGVATLSISLNGQNIEQTTPGPRPPARLVHAFDGLGVGFDGPQGTAILRNPTDNSQLPGCLS